MTAFAEDYQYQITLTASNDVIYGETPEDGVIAKVYSDPDMARVMAAAPDMLFALEEIMADKKTIRQQTLAVEFAKRAIRKAREGVPFSVPLD